ncbi:hypothetical protein [Mesorhizobium sp. NPDC059025]|uniref:hypothetical protein n=1 Tax=unclassified Mesorhizobium TaxID=325217 RepID=UPI00366A9630
MLWIAATMYSTFLFLVAAIPFGYIRGNALVIWGALLASLAALVIGLLIIIFSKLNVNSYSGWFILALGEEAARGLLLYRFVLRYENQLVQRALFGAIFGWLELLVKLYPSVTGCKEIVTPLSCVSGAPYLGISLAEPILFHIFITAIGYRDATNFKNWTIALFGAAVFHATINGAKVIPSSFNSGIMAGFVVLPTTFILLYAIVFYLVYLQNKGNLTLLNK